MKSEFDAYAKDYDTILNNALPDALNIESTYFSEYKIKELLDFCKKNQLYPKRILNFGCGTGKSEEFFVQYFPDTKIYGYDISQESIKIAKKRKLKQVYFFTLSDKSELKNDFFDIIFVSNVFHHIDHRLHSDILQNLYKKLKKRGHFILFEHNTLNPVTLKVVRQCELDKDAHLLPFWYTKSTLKNAGFKDIHLRFILFIPPSFPKMIFLEKYLGWLPVGAQYYVTAEKI